MKFIDEAIIEVRAGHGGSGAKSFRREKFVPYGGPDGGDGGRGGSVILKADQNRTTLLDFHFQPRWAAEDGSAGEGGGRTGKSGKDLIINLPVGTSIYRVLGVDEEKQAKLGELVVDLVEHGQEHVLAKGGRGGKGNAFFKSPTNRAPEHHQPGEAGEEGEFLLSLKLVADAGIIGFPNAGKSTLISRISSARPKVADYPFTTLTPNLGVVSTRGRSFVVADIPGLIPGAHEGKGLGIKFLKHVERTRVLVHLIDVLSPGGEPIGEEPSPEAIRRAYDAINFELSQFSAELSSRPQIVALTKVDAVSNREAVDAAVKNFAADGIEAISLSSATGENVDYLLGRVLELL